MSGRRGGSTGTHQHYEQKNLGMTTSLAKLAARIGAEERSKERAEKIEKQKSLKGKEALLTDDEILQIRTMSEIDGQSIDAIVAAFSGRADRQYIRRVLDGHMKKHIVPRAAKGQA